MVNILHEQMLNAPPFFSLLVVVWTVHWCVFRASPTIHQHILISPIPSSFDQLFINVGESQGSLSRVPILEWWQQILVCPVKWWASGRVPVTIYKVLYLFSPPSLSLSRKRLQVQESLTWESLQTCTLPCAVSGSAVVSYDHSECLLQLLDPLY